MIRNIGKHLCMQVFQQLNHCGSLPHPKLKGIMLPDPSVGCKISQDDLHTRVCCTPFYFQLFDQVASEFLLPVRLESFFKRKTQTSSLIILNTLLFLFFFFKFLFCTVRKEYYVPPTSSSMALYPAIK